MDEGKIGTKQIFTKSSDNPIMFITRMDRVDVVEAPAPKSGGFTDNSKHQNGTALSQDNDSNKKPPGDEESQTSFFAQTCAPFVLAGCGMVAAGVLLDKASSWPFLSEVPEALILVPALLGLKGNLEMTLASRLSTMANLGQLDQPQQRITTLYSNIALVQTQAIVVALIASLLAVSAHWIEGNQLDIARSVCVILSGIVSASITSMLLTSLMVFLVITARRYGLNPDNIATPLAAATGDVASLAFLIIFGTWFYRLREQYLMALIILLFLLISSVPAWTWVAVQHQWRPVINGVGGNLVAVQASKLSTYLHEFGKHGILPANTLITYVNPLRTFACKGLHIPIV
uniref:MgtE domain-containing protein n=1 Tax=Globodera pallida TaxID=36090 RepID=A0A183C2T1_GLOPA